jgi:uncharacterized damage-inducible protein DinB
MPGAHSIWELVLHLTAWKQEVLERLEGGNAGVPSMGDWPPLPGESEAHWQETLVRLDQSHRALVAGVRGSTDAVLDSVVRDERDRALGTGLTQWQTVHGSLQHDVYHTGQIALLLKGVRQGARRES